MLRSAIGELRPRDRVVLESHRVGESSRRGEVIEVLGGPGSERCRIQWEDGHETLVYPGADIRVDRNIDDGHEEIA